MKFRHSIEHKLFDDITVVTSNISYLLLLAIALVGVAEVSYSVVTPPIYQYLAWRSMGDSVNSELLSSSSLDVEGYEEDAINIFFKPFFWMASQLSYLALFAETAAEHSVLSTTTCCIIFICTCLWWCCCKKPARRHRRQGIYLIILRVIVPGLSVMEYLVSFPDLPDGKVLFHLVGLGMSLWNNT